MYIRKSEQFYNVFFFLGNIYIDTEVIEKGKFNNLSYVLNIFVFICTLF